MTALLRIKGCLPFMVMIFLNAFVDLGHKIIIQNTVFKVYDGQIQILLTAFVNALILLPFVFLFSPSGFIADRFAKPQVMRVSAAAAVVLTLLITLCYYQGWFVAGFAMTLLLAVQSAFYSPAKYGYIREWVGAARLTEANAMVQAVTIVAILMGVFVFSILFEHRLATRSWNNEAEILRAVAPVGWALVGFSLLELVMAYRLPVTEAAAPTLSEFRAADYLRGRYLKTNLASLRSGRIIWLSIIGLSIFWGISQVLLAAFPAYAKSVLQVTDTVMIQGLMACSAIGILLGSVVAGSRSRRHIETGLIPLGALGVVLSLWLLPQLTSPLSIGLAFAGLGLAGGLFIVPLNALIQFHAHADELGRVLAGNNWVQNLVMLSFLGLTLAFAYWGLSSLDLFHMLTLIGLAGALYTVQQLPHSLVRLLLARVFAGRYRIDVLGFEHLPARGGVLMLGNHISWVDWALVQIACPRPVRFVMDRNLYSRWYLKWLLDRLGVVPIAAGQSKAALAHINQLLKAGEVVCLFPEGAISRNGQLGEFKRGYERTVDGVDGVILPFYLRGLWGSRFSRSGEGLKNLRRVELRRDLIVALGKPLPINTGVAAVKQRVFELSLTAWDEHTRSLPTLPQAWLQTVKRHGSALCLADVQGGSELSGYRALSAALLFARRFKTHNRGQNLGLLLPTSSAGLLANMGGLIAGKTLVNLNYTANPAAIQAAAEQAGLETLISSRRFIDTLSKRGIDLETLLARQPVIYLEDLAAGLGKVEKLITLACVRLLPARLLRLLFLARRDLESPAAILFSSGSEGQPKGVVLSHRNIMGNIQQVSDVLDTRQDDRIMASLPLFHAFGLTVTGLLPLVEGIPAVCHPDPTDVVAIAKGIARYRVSVFCATGTFLRLFNRNSKVQPLMLESLRVVVAGAEHLPADVRDGFERKFNRPIFEGYGTTETTPVASVNIPDRLDRRDWHLQTGNRPGTVGLPLPGSCFRIVDPVTLDALPTGQDGLILIGGTQVMLGYLNDAQRTAEVIIELDGQRWYRSGDKGHLDADGFLTIVDRYSRFATW